MPTMKGVTISGPGAPYKVVNDLEIPEPGEHQVLVKSIATAINPVETYMQSSGLLINSFPIVLGCDASGIITAAHPTSTLKPGTRVSGCTRLGFPGYGTFQEYFLMDDRYCIVPPNSLSYVDAASMGVGCETACIGLLQGIQLALPSDSASPTKTGAEEWVVVLGGAGSVGQYSVQIAKLLGYKVVATCSSRTSSLVKGLGADATVDYSHSESQQFDAIVSATGGKFFGVWDTVAKSEAFGRKLLSEGSKVGKGVRKCYATTDDWSPMKEYDDHATHRAKLAFKGRTAEESGQPELEGKYVEFAKLLTEWFGEGKIKPNEVTVVEGGLEKVEEAVGLQLKGAGGKKVVLKIAEP